MIEKGIKAHLTQAYFMKLLLQKSKFQWTDSFGNVYNDGPIMIKIIMDGINQSTRVGFSAFKAQIEKATLAKYGNDVEKMLDEMHSTYNTIELDGSHEDFICHIFQNLLSGTNQVFHNFVRRERDEWDVGNDISADASTLKARKVPQHGPAGWMEKGSP